MTDNMDALCIHGEIWYECRSCGEEIFADLSFQDQLELHVLDHEEDFIKDLNRKLFGDG